MKHQYYRSFSFLTAFFLSISIYSFSQSPVSPKQGEVLFEKDVSILWNKNSSYSGYRIQLARDSFFSQVILDSLLLSNKVTIELDTGEYFFHIKGFSGIDTSNWSYQRSFTVFNPINLPKVKAWYSADSNIVNLNDEVEQLYDLSGNNGLALQSNTSSKPKLKENSLNYPTLSFDGDDYMVSNFNTTSSQPKTIFALWRVSQTAGVGQFCFDGINSTQRNSLSFITGNIRARANSNLEYSKSTPFDFIISSVEYNQASSKLFENGALLKSGNVGTGDLSGITLGSIYSLSSIYFLNGEIAEIIIIDTLLSQNQRTLVEDYLRFKYAPPVNLGANINIDYGFCDTTISAQKDWFKSYNWSNGDTTASIDVAHPGGTYWIQVTDIFGNVSSDTISISFPDFQLNDTTVCLFDSVKTNIDLPSGYNYSWSSGDTSRSIFISNEDLYSVTVSDSFNCQLQKSFNVEVDSFVNIINIGNDTTLCAGNSIGLIDGKSLVESYLWLPTNDTSSQIIINNTDTFVLNATSVNGCTGSDTISVNISGVAPSPNFQLPILCSGDSLQFTDLSTSNDPIASWQWIINNSDSSTIQNPKFLFNNSGNYSLKLRVTSINNCSNDTSTTIEINPSPEANFFDPLICVNQPAQFLNTSFIPVGNSLSSSSWYIDNILQSNDFEPLLNFSQIDSQQVSLSIELNTGCTDSIVKTVFPKNTFSSPEAFSLVSPSDKMVSIDSSIFFKWNLSVNANSYSLQIASDTSFNSITHQVDSFNFFNQLVNIQTPGKYYWRVIAFNPCGDSVKSSIRSFQYFTLPRLDKCRFWGAADFNTSIQLNDPAPSMTDISGNNNANQATTNAMPTKVISGLNKPTLRFDGDDYMVSNFNTTSSQPKTIFALWRVSQTAGVGQFCFDGINSTQRNSLSFITGNIRARANSNLEYNKSTPFDFIINSVEYNQASSNIYENGALLKSGNVGTGDLSGITLGSIYSLSSIYFLNGEIAEIIIIDTLLSQNQRTLVEDYLRFKYAPPVNLGANINIDYGFCDTTISAQKDWFKSYNWSNGDTTASINVNSSGLYSVTVTDIFGFTSSDNIKVVYPASSIINDTLICLGDSLSYSTEINSSIYNNFIWNDGATSTNRQITEEGFYFYSVDDSNGCNFTSDTLFVTVDSFVLKNLLVDSISLCEGNRLEVLDTSEITSYSWSNASNQIFTTVIDSGYYKLTTTNVNGCVALDSTYVNIKGTAPTVNFTTGLNCEGTPVNFTDQSTTSTGNISSWQWNFGDQNTSNDQNPSHLYDTTGIFNVQLTIETDSGCVGTGNQVITVEPRPIANFLYEITCVSQPVPFQELSAPPFGSFINDRKWYFGNGDSADVMNPVVNFDTAGTYQVSLISSAGNGCIDTVTKSVDVFPAINPAIEAENLCLGNDAQFYDASEGNSNVNWIWDFGGDGSSTQENPRHTFLLSGQYSISLTVTNAVGCTESVSKLITVAEEPIVDFIAESSCPGEPTNFSDLTQVVLGDSIIERIWTFGDSSVISRLPNPIHVYQDTGSYGVTLEVKSTLGCNSSATKSISVVPAPEAEFNFSPSFGGAPLDVEFSNQSIGANSYVWKFGDGSQTSTDLEPTHTYVNEGDYVVSLVAESNVGCTDTAFSDIFVTDALYDLIIMELETEKDIQDNCTYDLGTTVQFANQGTLPIRSVKLSLRLNEKATINEIWEGDLQPGAIAQYTFNSKVNIIDCDAQYYLCVEATYTDGNADQTPIDNKSCNSILPEIVVSNPYPNPGKYILSLDIIAPVKENLKIELVDYKGAKLGSLIDQEIVKGYSHYDFDISSLESGSYILNIDYREESISKRFVVIE